MDVQIFVRLLKDGSVLTIILTSLKVTAHVCEMNQLVVFIFLDFLFCVCGHNIDTFSSIFLTGKNWIFDF